MDKRQKEVAFPLGSRELKTWGKIMIAKLKLKKTRLSKEQEKRLRDNPPAISQEELRKMQLIRFRAHAAARWIFLD